MRSDSIISNRPHPLPQLGLQRGGGGKNQSLALNMVTTADGAAAVAHRTAPISNPADRQLFHELAGSAGSLSILDRAPLVEPVGLDLVWLLESQGQLFARYALRR
ncbi:MAG: hypothetical protein ACRDRA_10640 [Pseudonocardiaceae bacterium]